MSRDTRQHLAKLIVAGIALGHRMLTPAVRSRARCGDVLQCLPKSWFCGLSWFIDRRRERVTFHYKIFWRNSLRVRIESNIESKERVMIALGLVRVIEQHSDELAAELIAKMETSSRTTDLRKVPVEELRRGIQEILRHLGEWLLTKTGHDIEQRYLEIGGRRASQGVALSDFCWSIALTKGHLWEFLQRQGVMGSPIEIYGEMELLRLLDQFFDRALCFAAEGYEQYVPLRNSSDSRTREARKAAW